MSDPRPRSRHPARTRGAGLEVHREEGTGERRCAVCRQLRHEGSELDIARDGASSAWVCDDCQQKLARGVDDEGVRGG